MVEELLKGVIAKFNTLAEEDPRIKEEVADKVRTVQILLDEGSAYNFVMDHGHIDALNRGAVEGAEVTIACSEETLRGILSGETSALKAYAMKKLRLKASLQDLLTIRKLL